MQYFERNSAAVEASARRRHWLLCGAQQREASGAGERQSGIAAAPRESRRRAERRQSARGAASAATPDGQRTADSGQRTTGGRRQTPLRQAGRNQTRRDIEDSLTTKSEHETVRQHIEGAAAGSGSRAASVRPPAGHLLSMYSPGGQSRRRAAPNRTRLPHTPPPVAHGRLTRSHNSTNNRATRRVARSRSASGQL